MGVHNGDLRHDENPTPAAARDTDTASAPAGGGGGGGPSDTNASSDSASKLQHVDSLADGTPSGSSGLTLSSAEIPDFSPKLTSAGGIPDALLQSSGGGPHVDISVGGEPILAQIVSPGQGLLFGEIPNGLPHEIAVGASTGGALVDILVESDAHTTSDVISAITKGGPDIMSPVGLDTMASLKDVLGFDLHVNAAGGFVANDLSAALDVNHSQFVADVVSTASSPVAEGLPLLGVGASKAVDSVLSGKGLLDVGHLNDVTSSVVATSGLSGDLGGRLPIITAISDAPPVGIIGEATDITPGHSIDFSAQALPEGDVLFSGHSYTDYHVTLQTEGPSVVGNSIAATATSVTNTHDAAPLSHVDSPAVSHPATRSGRGRNSGQQVLTKHQATPILDQSHEGVLI